MPGFGTPPPPWRCRIYSDGALFATLAIAAVDGRPILADNATETAVLIVSLLQQPTDPGCQQRLAARLGDDAAAALAKLGSEIDSVFRVVLVTPQGKDHSEGLSIAAARRPSYRMGSGQIRVKDPTKIAS